MLPLEGSNSPNHICSVCQASFTRKTHLTRHLRSHLNQRTHSCSICGRAAFTRSDLLRRHVKRCSLDTDGLPPSRTKACQTCIRRKVKCDLRKPCAKCMERGGDCVYQGHRVADTERDGEPSGEGDNSIFLNRLERSLSAGTPLESAGDCDLNSAPFMADLEHPLAPSIGHTSNPPSTSFGVLTNISGSSSSTQTLKHISESCLTSQLVPRFNAGTFQSDFIIDVNSALPDDAFNQLASDSFPRSPGSMLRPLPWVIPRPLAPAAEPNADPGAPETDIYLALYLSSHCHQYPFLHRPTWSQSTTSPLLLRAMRACGALYVTAPDAECAAADQFISDTLQSELRQHIFRTFMKTPGNDVVTQAALVLAFASLQTVGLFHRCSHERSISAAYHSMMITMMRRSAIRAFVDSWEMLPADLLNPLEAWTSWSRYEAMKRIILLVYLHDTLMPVFHNLPPSFGESELDIRLPCDDELWDAPDADRWAQLTSAGAPSTLFWASSPRTYLEGESLKTVLADMLNPLSTVLTPLNRFACFVMIHTLFRVIHLSKSSDHEARLSIQHALTQWYVIRLSVASGLGTAQSPSGALAKLDFTSSALPLYWLAQLSLAASVPMSHVGPARFKTIKRWLKDFWSVVHEAGEAGAGIGLAGVSDTTAGSALVEEMSDEQELPHKADAGLLEWIPRTRSNSVLTTLSQGD